MLKTAFALRGLLILAASIETALLGEGARNNNSGPAGQVGTLQNKVGFQRDIPKLGSGTTLRHFSLNLLGQPLGTKRDSEI